MSVHAWTRRARVVAIFGIFSCSSLGGMPVASAVSPAPEGAGAHHVVLNWESSMTSVLSGFQSRRWDDVSYSEVRFTGCTTTEDDPRVDESAEVEMRQDRSFQPDKSWGKKTARHCFDSRSSVSSGEWTGLDAGRYYFQIGLINTRVDDALSVARVYVDTTRAD
ncbi:hypothetical protein AB0D24_39620 [Streptomyces javensis]|uniref:hypothetical protein n=1 Tax=Streptomyces javensis TaxID=114698 RepID=UPI0033D07F3E